MKKQLLTILLAGLAMLAPTQAADKSGAEKAKMRIGIYDSRAVACAYCGTPMHEAEIKALDDALKQAKASGDPAKIKEADAAVWEARKRLHRQGFSTFSVDDILGKITNEVSRIKAQAQVSALVSKWDKATLAKYPKAEQVDVTAQLIDAFQPKARQRKSAEEIQKQKPIPPDKMEKVLEQEARSKH